MYSHIQDTWVQYYKKRPEEYKQLLEKLRAMPRVFRVERPFRLNRARAIGYRAKQGYVVLVVKTSKGGMKIQRPRSGRRQRHIGSRLISGQASKYDIAVKRAAGEYRNLKLLGGYYLAEDGKHVWYELIMVDPQIVKEPGL